MSSDRPRAVLYLRISDDPTGLAAGIDRQRSDGLRLADREGYDVVAEYVDNDRSAYSGKPRPQFDRMLRDASLDGFDVVVVWASDRLYRRVADLTRITEELAPYARIAAVMGGGDIDLTSAEGILRAQVLGSVGEFESRRKSERVAARAVQRSKGEGRMSASVRPIGWSWADPCPAGAECRHPKRCAVPGERPRPGVRTGVVVNPVEAEVLAAAYQHVADGGTVVGATRLFAASGLPTRKGGKWSPATVRTALMNPRNAGLVAHRGEIVAEAKDGQRIVPPELWQRVKGILEDPERRTTPGRPAGTPLSGIARCGRCGGPMNASKKTERAGSPKRPVYICAREQHLSRGRALVDEPVLRVVRDWLVEYGDKIAPHAQPGAGPAQTKAAAQVVELTDRLASLSELVASGALAPEDYASATSSIRGRLVDARRRAVVSAGKPALAHLLDADDVGAVFDSLVAAEDPEPLRAVLREILDAVVVIPGKQGLDGLDVRWSPWTASVVNV